MAKISQTSKYHLVKREDRQPVHSFKLRGAYNLDCRVNAGAKGKELIYCISEIMPKGGIISQSNGRKSINCDAYYGDGYQVDVRQFGEALLYGANFDEAKSHRFGKDGIFYSFDDPRRDVAGAEHSLAMELCTTDVHLDQYFVPVGGTGLLY